MTKKTGKTRKASKKTALCAAMAGLTLASSAMPVSAAGYGFVSPTNTIDCRNAANVSDDSGYGATYAWINQDIADILPPFHSVGKDKELQVSGVSKAIKFIVPDGTYVRTLSYVKKAQSCPPGTGHRAADCPAGEENHEEENTNARAIDPRYTNMIYGVEAKGSVTIPDPGAITMTELSADKDLTVRNTSVKVINDITVKGDLNVEKGLVNTETALTAPVITADGNVNVEEHTKVNAKVIEDADGSPVIHMMGNAKGDVGLGVQWDGKDYRAGVGKEDFAKDGHLTVNNGADGTSAEQIAVDLDLNGGNQVTVDGRESYVVSLDCADGVKVTGEGVYRPGSRVTVKAKADGLTFAGWEENGKVVSRDEAYTFDLDTNRHLTAVYSDQYGVKVTYHSNSDTPKDVVKTAKKGGSLTLAAPKELGMDGRKVEINGPVAFHGEERIFTGWNTKADGTGTSYESGAVIQNAELDLYAQWASHDITKADVSVESHADYTGKALTVPVEIKMDGKQLKEGTDYTVAYTDNTGKLVTSAGAPVKAEGRGTVTIKGTGEYAGTVTRQFDISLGEKDTYRAKISFYTNGKTELGDWTGLYKEWKEPTKMAAARAIELIKDCEDNGFTGMADLADSEVFTDLNDEIVTLNTFAVWMALNK